MNWLGQNKRGAIFITLVGEIKNNRDGYRQRSCAHAGLFSC